MLLTARRFHPAIQLDEWRDRAIHGVGDRAQNFAFTGSEFAVAGDRVCRRLKLVLAAVGEELHEREFVKPASLL